MSGIQDERQQGLGTVAQGVVIVAVFACVLTGMLALAQREVAVAELAAQSAAPTPTASRRPDATPVPAPDAAGAGTYTVQPGDSIFSVASTLGIGPNELIYWNRDEYPTLQSTPALKPGWVLRTDGPPLPTPTPDATPEPTTPEPQLAGPDGVALPVFGASAFPASGSVTVEYYTVTGGSVFDIARSIDANGPYSDWIGGRADAAVETSASFDFRFVGAGSDGCEIQLFDDTPVDVTYHVILPSWVPPADVSASLVEWWIATLDETVAHERHHIELYESFLPRMHAAVRDGTCESAEADLLRLWDEAGRANCMFDLEEYGYAAGLTIADCGEV